MVKVLLLKRIKCVEYELGDLFKIDEMKSEWE